MAKEFKFKKVIEDMTPAQVCKQQQEIKKLNLSAIETLDFLYSDGGEVTYATDELTAVCPMTGLPDFYTLNITYIPAKLVPELKSLKLYLIDFRNLPILHEHLACRIHDDFKKTVKPKKLTVELIANTRGGIDSRVVKESKRK